MSRAWVRKTSSGTTPSPVPSRGNDGLSTSMHANAESKGEVDVLLTNQYGQARFFPSQELVLKSGDIGHTLPVELVLGEQLPRFPRRPEVRMVNLSRRRPERRPVS